MCSASLLVELITLHGCPGSTSKASPPVHSTRAGIGAWWTDIGVATGLDQGTDVLARPVQSQPGPGCIPLFCLYSCGYTNGLDQGVDVLARFVRTEPVGQRDAGAHPKKGN